MKVLVNASNLTKGGGIQVAASFICEACELDGPVDWHYAVSTAVAEELAGLGIEVPNLHQFHASPARDRNVRRMLKMLERDLEPDVVFTVFGPTYVRFSKPHLLGVAVGWVTHSTRLAYRSLPSWSARIKALLSTIYRGLWLRQADHWIVEAENARQGLSRRMRIPLGKIDVVPNTCSSVFASADIAAAGFPEQTQKVRLLYVSAYYPHKRLEMIPATAAALRQRLPNREFEFIMTLPPAEAAAIIAAAGRLGVEAQVVNVGPVRQHELVERYRDSEICFMPSVLETFSATYVEAMAAGRPVVTSDLDFAHAVCGDSAVYFIPDDPDSAADAILALLEDRDLWHNCVRRGKTVLEQLPSARQRYEHYLARISALAGHAPSESKA